MAELALIGVTVADQFAGVGQCFVGGAIGADQLHRAIELRAFAAEISQPKAVRDHLRVGEQAVHLLEASLNCVESFVHALRIAGGVTSARSRARVRRRWP